MKKLYFILAIALFVSGKVFSQPWVQQVSPTTSNLFSVHFSSELNGWASGASGTFIKTIDGGTTWTTVNTGVTATLYNTWFTSDTKGFTGGQNGTFLRTNDGGQSWESIDLGSPYTVHAIYFVDENNGYVGGFNPSFVQKTTDGGDTWTPVTNPLGVHVLDMFWITASEGWVVGADGALNGWIAHTSNSGQSWEYQTPSNIDCDTYTDIFFLTPLKGFATGYFGVLAKTLDGGDTWSQVDFPFENDDFNSIHFSSPEVGFVSNSADSKRTEDGGETWNTYYCNTGEYALDIYCISDDKAMAVGINGRMALWGCSAEAPDGAGTQVFCESDDPQLSDIQLNGEGIVWFGTSIGGTAYPSTTALVDGTTYYAAQTAGGNCLSPERFPVLVQVNEVNVGITQNGSTLTSNSDGAVYQWINCNTNQPVPDATGQSFTPATSGSYAVTVTADGCTDTSTCISVTTDIREQQRTARLSTYPNPADDILFLKGDGVYNGAGYQLFDTRGALVASGSIQSLSIDISALQSGLYFVEVNAHGEMLRTAFSKK